MMSTLDAAVAHLIMLLLQEANLVAVLIIKSCVGQHVIPFFVTCDTSKRRNGQKCEEYRGVSLFRGHTYSLCLSGISIVAVSLFLSIFVCCLHEGD